MNLYHTHFLGHYHTFKTQYRYDTWNRLKSLTYPDGEIVTYTYDKGGNLKTMTGEKMGDTYIYITNIHYNEFEKKVSIEYGNGVITYYDYDDELHRLARLVTENSQGDILQYNRYEYDDVNNILSIRSRGNILDSLVGESINTYTYDSLYRLIYSTNYENGVPPNNRGYELIMQYTAGGRITEKTQNAATILDNQNGVINNQYEYTYYPNHTLFNIDGSPNNQFKWDANGNLISVEKYRLLAWDEENRLAGVSDENQGIFCFYDANGERTLKLSTNSIYLTINGQQRKDIQVTNAVMYASPYWVVDEKCYSKHYYAGSDRVCSKIGGGISSYWYEDTLVGWENVYNKKKRQIEYLNRTAYKLGEYNPEFEFNGQGNPDIILNLELTKLDSLNTYEPECYYYHTDHIGSTSWITDVNGGWIQYCEYLPFGEPLVDQRSYKWNSRYTFSGKERDGETGYSYFGARYYNSDLSIWLSVDPLSDKYPNLTPYAYCANNPIILVDPDGRKVVIDGEQAEVAYNSLQEGTNLKLERNEFGVLSVSGGDPLNDNDKMLLDAINSESVTVNIDASAGYQGAGEYHGTTYDAESNTANSINGVNIKELISLEKNGAAGSGMMHEVTEGYQMGLISIENKSSIARAGWKPEQITIGAGNMQRTVITQKYENPHDYGLYQVGHARATGAPNEMSRKEARNYKAPQERYTFPLINKSMEMFHSKLFRGF